MISRQHASLLDRANDYLADGWSVFPVCTPVVGRSGQCQQHGKCKNPGKTPLVKWGTYQDRLAGHEETARWWQTWPNANIGLATGELSGVVVVDLDGELAIAEAERRGYECGPWVRTGRVGGRHLYFQYRPDAPTIFAKTGGIDFRGQGGFVLLPPSVHYSGATYQWGEPVVRGDPVPVLPRWVDDLAGVAQDGSPRGKVDFGHLVSEGIAEGQRDQELFRAAAKLRGIGLQYDVALEVIGKVAAQCHPPFDFEEARLKVDSAYGRYLPNPARTDQHDELVSAAALVRMELPEPRWAIPGIFPEGVVLLVGKSKLGKSWLVLDAALAISGDRLVWGNRGVEQGDVLYLALEDSKRRLQDRLRKLCGTQAPVRLVITTRWERADEGGMERILTWLDDHPNARMIVIDVLGKFRPREANLKRLYDLDYDAIAPLAEVARSRGVCVVVIHHTNKLNPEDPVDSVSGTTGLAGAADAIAIFRRERGKADASLFVVGRDVEEQEIAFRRALDQGSGYAWEIIGDAAEVRMSAERQEIIDVVTSQPGLSPVGVADAVNRSRQNTRYLLFKMVQAGQVRNYDGKYFPCLDLNHASTANSANTLTADPILNSIIGQVAQKPAANTPLTPLTPVSPSRGVTPVRGVSGDSDISAVSSKPTCRACGGELSPAEAAARYQLHFDCTLPFDPQATG